jgi:hypothetical protein
VAIPVAFPVVGPTSEEEEAADVIVDSAIADAASSELRHINRATFRLDEAGCRALEEMEGDFSVVKMLTPQMLARLGAVLGVGASRSERRRGYQREDSVELDCFWALFALGGMLGFLEESRGLAALTGVFVGYQLDRGWIDDARVEEYLSSTY